MMLQVPLQWLPTDPAFLCQSSFHIRSPRTDTPDSRVTFTSRPDWNRAITPKKFPKAAFLTSFWEGKKKKKRVKIYFPEKLDFTWSVEQDGRKIQPWTLHHEKKTYWKASPCTMFKNCPRAPLQHTDKSHLKQGQMTMSSTSNFWKCLLFHYSHLL